MSASTRDGFQPQNQSPLVSGQHDSRCPGCWDARRKWGHGIMGEWLLMREGWGIPGSSAGNAWGDTLWGTELDLLHVYIIGAGTRNSLHLLFVPWDWNVPKARKDVTDYLDAYPVEVEARSKCGEIRGAGVGVDRCRGPERLPALQETTLSGLCLPACLPACLAHFTTPSAWPPSDS